ncbi:TetR/AcrR family transcriptional regulator [Planctomonas psychrotolerans]|uniref:TetR/AcrR family transcriptional regulator n=1 Tax=Planctomonas psychrotolerans TaxID=2528712 RepID=UPI001D0D5122|nr:TetR/AcrR family transcriptional regulator [Planctomonas psychrotolerans]
MLPATPTTERPASPAKARLLEVADDLFYREGIHTVGIDRIIAAAGVTKATFYKQFGSKDGLILDYIVARTVDMQQRVTELASDGRSADDVLRTIVTGIVDETSRTGFRGSAFIHAAAEFPDSAHPVRVVIFEHREWFQEFLTDQLKRLGHRRAGDGADELLLLMDGVMTGAYAGDSIAAYTGFLRAVERVLAEATPRA